MLGVLKKDYRCEGNVKNNFSQKMRFMAFGVFFCNLLEAFVAVFLIFAASETASDIDAFSRGTGSNEMGVVVLNNVRFQAHKQLSRR